MAKKYELKIDQNSKAILDDVEVEAIETTTKTDKETTCLRKIKAEMEEIDNQIVQLKEQKTKLEEEAIKIQTEAEKYSLKIVE